jgi:1-phosphatidylinositol-4-phosphate 5-kinase
MSSGTTISKEDFKKNMRINEFKLLGYISDRIFEVMNKSRSGSVSLQEYLSYMDVMNYGSSEDKARQSFQIIAGVDSEVISYKTFKKWLISASKTRNLNTGEEISLSDLDIKEYFRAIDKNDDDCIDFEEYLHSLVEQPQFRELVQVFEHDFTERLNVPCIENFTRENPQYKKKIKELEDMIGELIVYLEENNMKPMKDLTINMSEIRLGLRTSDRLHTTVRNEHKGHHEILRRSTIVSNTLRISKRRYSAKYDIVKDTLQNLLGNLKRLKQGQNVEEDSGYDRMPSKTWTRTIPKKLTLQKNDVIYWGDDDWNLILNMMLGIQKSVKEKVAEGESLPNVTSDMFIEKVKHKLLRSQVKSNKTFKFRDYAPSIFERIRKLYNIKPAEYIRSLGMEKIMHALVANEFSSLTGMCTTGKSGSFFYYSDDGKYMLKTVSTEEYKFFWQFLPDYYFHLYKNPHTLITRFFGFHKIIDCGSRKEIYFVVMGNLFKSDYEIDVKYDLKGSTLGRLTLDKEDKSIARKDNNFNLEGRKILIGSKRKEYIMEQIKKDVEVLQRNNIIDYSLLLGISKVDHKVPVKKGFAIFNEVDDGGMMSDNGEDLYFLGIIDILTFYGARKKLEHFFKTTIHKKQAVSCAPPAFYAERFLRYMDEVFL